MAKSIQMSESRRVVQRFFMGVLASPLSLLILLAAPIYRVRFGIFPVDEIGPLTRNPHHYLWAGKSSKGVFGVDMWVYKPGTFVSNHLVLAKWKMLLRVKNSWFWWQCAQLTLRLGGARHRIDIERSWAKLPSRQFDFQLSLDANEVNQFREQMGHIRLDLGEPFIALCIRDSSYKQRNRRESLETDRKEEFRNHRIADFVEMAKAVSELGVSVVRMGVVVNEPMPHVGNRVFDYASSGLRTELADIGLLSQCQLCVTTSLGVDQLAAISGKPRCVVNHFPPRATFDFYPWDFIIPQRVVDMTADRVLTLREALTNDAVRRFRGSEELEDAGLGLVKNSPTEIRDVVLEALAAGYSAQHLDETDARRQARYWEVLSEYVEIPSMSLQHRPRLGSVFLRENEWWLQ